MLTVVNSYLPKVSSCVLVASIALVSVGQAHAYELYKTADSELSADVTAVFGLFHSEESYAQVRTSSGSQTWQKGFVKLGLFALLRTG